MIRPLCIAFFQVSVALLVVAGASENLHCCYAEDEFALVVSFQGDAQASLYFSDKHDFGYIERAIKHVESHPDVSSITLIGERIKDYHIGVLSEQRRLKKVTIQSKSLSDDGVRFFAGLSQLEELSIESENIAGHTLGDLRKLRYLRNLTLNGCRLDKTGVEALCSLVHIRELSASSTGLTDDMIGSLRHLRLLERLDISENPLTAERLKALESMTQLRELNLPFMLKTDEGLRHLPSLPNLRGLILYNVADEGLAGLTRFPCLERLDIDSGVIEDREMRIVSQMPRLDALMLNNVSLPATFSTHIERCKALRSFELTSAKVPSGLTRSLASLSRLEHVSLSYTAVTDEDIEPLSAAPNLQSVFLLQTRVGDGALESLAKCRCITTIDVRGCRLTSSGLRKLETAKTLELLLCDGNGMDATIDALQKAVSNLKCN